jgi:fumarylacetoacetase
MNKIQNSWLEVPENSDFPIQNIPFGIIKSAGRKPVVATRIGDMAIDLSILADAGYLDGLGLSDFRVFKAKVLNDFIALGKQTTGAVRTRLMELFGADNSKLRQDEETCSQALFPVGEVEVLLPVNIGDYTDFYSSIEHATNVGIMFRDPKNALLPNWRYIPVGYHGRSSSIVVSGAEIHRPKGQLKPDDGDKPVFGSTRQLDFELEMAFVTGKETRLGESIPVDKAEEYIFGMVIFNDLSARDIQKWEYVPLGPFLGKNFGSVVSPWIVTLEALEPFRTHGPEQKPAVLPYLQVSGNKNIDIQLDVFLKPDDGEENLLSYTNFKYMYWNMNQQLAHQTVNGCNVRVGDMYASGTISGTTPETYGSMLELSWRGTKPIRLKDGSERKFISDGDTVIMRGYCEKDGLHIGFGECIAKILPSL